MHVKYYIKALLCLYSTLLTINCADGQSLKVGDSLPPELWSMTLQVVNHPQGKETLTLNEYKDKLIILDFWATWCAPCIKSLTKLDSVQNSIGSSLAVIPISNEKPEKVMPFLEKRGLKLLSVVNGEHVVPYFPHKGIPHQVWIKKGVVYAITGGNYSSSDYYSQVIEGKDVKMVAKEEEIDFVPEDMLVVKPGIHHESGLLGVVNKGIGSRLSLCKWGMVFTNATAESLFKVAFRANYPFIEANNRVLWELPDSVIYRLRLPEVSYLRSYEEDAEFKIWQERNFFTYYSRYAEPIPRPELFRKMQEDISSFFRALYGVTMHIEKRVVPCYVLRKEVQEKGEKGPEVAFTQQFTDTPLDVIAKTLGKLLAYQTLPILDETSSKEKITLSLTNVRDIVTLQKELLMAGLDLRKEEREIDMVVFKMGEI